jgi:uncharacterized membrane protein YqjE
LLKEYGTPFGWISVLVLMTMFNFWMSGQWSARQKDVHALLVVLGVATAMWLVAWSIKRSRWLVAD